MKAVDLHLSGSDVLHSIWGIIHIDGHKSKPAISILAIVQESRKTFTFRYFSSYFFIS